MRILVTGANGFVGKSLCRSLLADGCSVLRALRCGDATLPEGIETAVVGDIGPDTDWRFALTPGGNGESVDAVVHLAARVHVMRDGAADPLAEFRKVNVEGTLNLARQAAVAGVRRFVFLSSVKVNGEGFPHPGTEPPHPGPPPRGGREWSGGERGVYDEADAPAPQDAYAVSKWEAEQGLAAIAQETGMEVVVLRPPLVYGPGVGGNFLRLLRLVERGVPLPLGAVDNRRSLLYLGNLVDAIALCLAHSAAANRTYLVSDGEDISTSDLIRKLAAQMGRRARLLPVPAALLEWGGRLVGKGAEAQRLLGSLAVDSGRIRSELGWRPPFTLDEGLAETVRGYRGSQLQGASNK